MTMSFRKILSIITFVLIVTLIWVSRHELVQAWELLSQVNMWILALFIPLVVLNYFAVGEMIFSYLRDKGYMKNVHPLVQVRMALETNFVNHALPSGGASGMSYMTWRLSKYGVPVAKATIAQVLRTVLGFVGLTILLVLSVIVVTLDHGVNRFIILMSAGLVGAMILATIVGIYALSSKARTNKLAQWITAVGNGVTSRVTFGKKKQVLKYEKIDTFMLELHKDYLQLRRDKRVMIKPFWWVLIYLVTDIMMFFVTFWSLGSIVNPAAILIGYAIAMVAAFVVVTPGGSGPFELIMVSVLVVSGLTQSAAVAGIVLARALILFVIVALGYFSYQHAIAKKG